jgi:hypothetical protein
MHLRHISMENKYVHICYLSIIWLVVRLAVSSYCGYLTDSEIDPSDHYAVQVARRVSG